MAYSVKLNVYDLLNLAGPGIKQMASQFMPGFSSIWHTGIVVYNIEYFYGGGIQRQPAGMPSQYGTPTEVIDLGTTDIPKDMFEDFLSGINDKFSMNTYDLFHNNCNHFTEECSLFLTGSSIPVHIRDLPSSFLNSPIGQMIGPLISNLNSNNGGLGNGGNMPDLASLNNMANMFGQGGLGNNFGGLGNNFGGLGNNNNNNNNNNNSNNNNSNNVVKEKETHSNIKLPTLSVTSKIPSLFSSTKTVPKIIKKLNSFIENLDTISEEELQIIQSLKDCFIKRKSEPEYPIPSGCFNLFEKLLVGNVLPIDKIFPVLDLFRILVLHPTANQYFTSDKISIIDTLFDTLFSNDNKPPVACLWLFSRVISNMFSHRFGRKVLLNKTYFPKVIDIIINGLGSNTKQFKHTAATLSYNCCVFIRDEEDQMEILTAVIQSLNEPEKYNDESKFTLLMCLGRILFKNEEAIEIADALELQLDPFLNSEINKVKNAANEIKLLIETPVTL